MSQFVERKQLRTAVERALTRYPVVAILGPRQVGKTTLGRTIVPDPARWFDLESPIDLMRLGSAGERFERLRDLSGRVLIDEVQQIPELFQELRVLVDQPARRASFVLTGSQSPEVRTGIAESLAGRVHWLEMSGFNLAEIDPIQWRRLWLRGGYPSSFLADDDEMSWEWRSDFARTYLLRDIERIARGGLSPVDLARLLAKFAHSHGQFWNERNMAGDLGIDQRTIRRYRDILVDTFVLREVPPLFRNIGKRLRQASRYYFRDSGLLHYLLGLQTNEKLRDDSHYGASFEGFGVEQILSLMHRDARPSVWRTRVGAEVDLVVEYAGKTIGFEFKVAQNPTIEKGTHLAVADIPLDHLYVVHSGHESTQIDERIATVPIHRLVEISTVIA